MRRRADQPLPLEQFAVDRTVEYAGATKPSSLRAAMNVEVFQ
jgi:hypothetical protein